MSSVRCARAFRTLDFYCNRNAHSRPGPNMARPLVSCDGSPRGVPFSGARPAAFHDFDSPLHVAQRRLKMSNPRRRHLLSVLAALPYRRIRRREPRPPRARPPTMIVWPFSSPYAPRRSFASSSMAVVPPAAIPLPRRSARPFMDRRRGLREAVRVCMQIPSSPELNCYFLLSTLPPRYGRGPFPNGFPR